MFSGFTVADFDCYETRKWKSNLFNRERMEVKQKLLDLARSAFGSLLDADGAPLFIEASVEHPSLSNHKQVEAQHIFFSRNEMARKELDRIIDRQKPMATLLDDPTPQRNHVFLALSLNYEGLEVSLKLHPDAWVDRQNLERKMEDHYAVEKLLDLLHDLPAPFTIGITPEKILIHSQDEASSFDMNALRSLVKQLPPSSPDHSLVMQSNVVRLFCISQSLAKKAILGEAGHNPLSHQQTIEWMKEGLTKLLPLYQQIAWSRRNDYVSVKQVLDQEKVSQKQKGLGKKDTIRVVRGLWAGKSGVISELDAKGQLKVLIGKMAIKIDANDVEKVDV